MELGSHVWHLCHLAFWASLSHLLGALVLLGFWFLGISLPFVSFGVWLLAGEVLVQFGFVGLVWAHRHLVQTAQFNMGIAHSKVPHSTWEPREKFFFFWTGQSIAMIQWQEKWPKNIRSLLTYDRKMGWSSLMSRNSSCNQQLGADQTKTPTFPEGQSLLGPICPCYQGQVER